MDCIRLDNNVWKWYNYPKENVKNIYKITEYITILYSKTIQKPQHFVDLYNLTRNEIIIYINMFGFSLIKLGNLSKDTHYFCDICGKTKTCKFYNFNINNLFTVCEDCVSIKYKSCIINHRRSTSNTFIDMIDERIDVAHIYNNQLTYLYHSSYIADKFNYKTILYEPWYQRDSKNECLWCKKNKRHFNSMCVECLDFSYQTTFKFVIIGWLTFESLNDVRNVIFTKLLNLLGYDIDLINLLIMNNPINREKEEKEKDEKEELITEDNLYDYVKFDLNSSEENECELGYWD